MRKYLIYTAAVFVIVGIITYFARSLGWYNDYWYTDVFLHTLSGVGFGIFWIGLSKKSTASFLVITLGAVSFAALGSVLWEFWEFAGWRITPSHTQFYFPGLADTLSDIACGLAGGAFTGVIDKTLQKIGLLER